MESGTRTAVKIVTMLFEGPSEAVPELGCIVGVEGSAAGAVADDDSDDTDDNTDVNVPDVKLCNVEFPSEL